MEPTLRVSDLTGLGLGPRVCISDEPPGNIAAAAAAAAGTML